ncbi:MAG: hypothetical protein LUE12_07650 [Ruminococcus sp.]|nr:hypothetical protein [Ruminococcus sp.]
MKTKNCPFCSKKISDEAIICKYCHRLLIDENGNDIQPDEAVAAAEDMEEITIDKETIEAAKNYSEQTAVSEDKTIIYSKEDLLNALNDSSEIDDSEAKDSFENGYTYENETEDNSESFENTDYDEYYSSEESQSENSFDDHTDFSDFQVFADELENTDNDKTYQNDNELSDYQDEGDEQTGDDPRRTFIITAIITVGILIIIIAAVCVGFRLFGMGSDDESSSAVITTTPKTTASAEEDSTASAVEYVPQVTDETVSEEPEETTASSEASDPVDEESETDSESAEDSAADTDSSEAEDSTEDTTSSASTDGAPSFEPEGSYYSWDEVFTLWENYMSANNMTGSYSYNGGTDAVEMFFLYTDENGYSINYRVDLVTGYITVSQ